MPKRTPVTLHGHRIGATIQAEDGTHEAWLFVAGLGYTQAGFGGGEFDTQEAAEQAVINEYNRITS